MSRYFTYLPKVTYDNMEVVDITARANILESIKGNTIAFLNYTVKEGERAEDIAYYYYNDIGKVWLVYLANNIIDPYTQWPLSNADFERMLITKYTTLSNMTGSAVVSWAQSNVIHYENIADPTVKITSKTYTLNGSLGLIQAGEWRSVSYYQYELEKNEAKRTIFLVNRVYADQMEKELESIMNG